MHFLQSLSKKVFAHRKQILLAIVGLFVFSVGALLANYFMIDRHGSYVIAEPNHSDSLVGVVFGGGIEDGKPRESIRHRLDAGAHLLETNKVRKLILSGDNRFDHYNEPEAMWNYLTQEKGVPADKLQTDNAGRSTYETCERAKKIFGLNEALLISEASHLPRAIYLCRSFGIQANGYASDSQPSSGLMTWQNFREIWARGKATFNVYVVGEETVLGDPIPL